MPNILQFEGPDGQTMQIVANQLETLGRNPDEIHLNLSNQLGFGRVEEFLEVNGKNLVACATPKPDVHAVGADEYTGT